MSEAERIDIKILGKVKAGQWVVSDIYFLLCTFWKNLSNEFRMLVGWGAGRHQFAMLGVREYSWEEPPPPQPLLSTGMLGGLRFS